MKWVCTDVKMAVLYAKKTLHLQGEYRVIIYNCLTRHEQRHYKKLFFSMDSVEFKVRRAPFAVNGI